MATVSQNNEIFLTEHTDGRMFPFVIHDTSAPECVLELTDVQARSLYELLAHHIGERDRAVAAQRQADIYELLAHFGSEFEALPPVLAEAVIDDYQAASRADQCEYRTNIGTGNLLGYARCLVIQRERAQR